MIWVVSAGILLLIAMGGFIVSTMDENTDKIVEALKSNNKDRETMIKEGMEHTLQLFCATQYDCYDCPLLVEKDLKFNCAWQDNEASVIECYKKVKDLVKEEDCLCPCDHCHRVYLEEVCSWVCDYGKLIKERKDKENG